MMNKPNYAFQFTKKSDRWITHTIFLTNWSLCDIAEGILALSSSFLFSLATYVLIGA